MSPDLDPNTPAHPSKPAGVGTAVQARVGLFAAVVLLVACFALLVVNGRASATPASSDRPAMHEPTQATAGDASPRAG